MKKFRIFPDTKKKQNYQKQPKEEIRGLMAQMLRKCV